MSVESPVQASERLSPHRITCRWSGLSGVSLVQILMRMLIMCLILGSVSIAIACESRQFKAFYLPLDASFYVPPTRDYIVQYGNEVELSSCELVRLFEIVASQKGTEPQPEDLASLRILIVDESDGGDVFITAKKRILHMNSSYDVKADLVEKIIREIRDKLGDGDRKRE